MDRFRHDIPSLDNKKKKEGISSTQQQQITDREEKEKNFPFLRVG